MWRCLALISWIAPVTQAYAPIQWIGSPVKGAVLMPRFAGRFQNSAPSPTLALMVPPDDMSPDKIPHFTMNSDESISCDNWCIEAGGDTSENLVRVSYCTGKPHQKWALRADDYGRVMIQPKDSHPGKCLDVLGTRGLNAAPIGLRECDKEGKASWQFGEPIANPKQRMSQNMRHLAMSVLALAGVSVLSLGSLLWRRRPKARAVLAGGQRGMPSSDDEGGVSLVTPLALRKDPLDCRGCVMMQQNPGVSSISTPDNVKGKLAEDFNESCAFLSTKGRSFRSFRNADATLSADLSQIIKGIEKHALRYKRMPFAVKNLMHNKAAELLDVPAVMIVIPLGSKHFRLSRRAHARAHARTFARARGRARSGAIDMSCQQNWKKAAQARSTRPQPEVLARAAARKPLQVFMTMDDDGAKSKGATTRRELGPVAILAILGAVAVPYLLVFGAFFYAEGADNQEGNTKKDDTNK